MAFLKSHIPFPPMVLTPGSCEAERIYAALGKAIEPLAMTREESERRQLAYEVQRARWRKEVGITDTK